MSTDIISGFAQGEQLVLRPVQESDLADLARIMAQEPCGGGKTLPWTRQRLLKQYEDEKEPGLWRNEAKVFAALLRRDGSLVGFVREHYEAWIQSFLISFHVDDSRADRAALGRELVALYMDYLLRWHDPGMVTSEPLDFEADKRAWLEAAGFRHQFTQERAELWLGRAVGRCAYAWHSAERGAGVDYSLGEPEYPAHGASRSKAVASVPGRDAEVN